MFLCLLDEKDDVEDHRRTEYMIKILLSQQHRWKDVGFAWFNVNCSDEFPGLAVTNASMLTSLSLHVEFPMRAAISIAQSSRLKSLDLVGYSDLSVTGEPFRHDNCFPLLLLSLRALKLEYGEAAAAIVDNLTLPSLEAFYYASGVKEGMLFSFFQRSRSPLTFLAICGPCTGEDENFGILRLLPCLKALRYSFSIVSKHFFTELAALEQCFEDRKRHLVVGDYENAFRNASPPNSD
ncbi:hypothetical protein ACEPAF_5857 [Sanghuangporus sanghuang]